MFARSPIVQRWSDMWALVIPRSRLGAGVTRRHLLLVALTLAIGVLVILYLHLVGQIALINYQTELLQAHKRALLEENAQLEAQLGPFLSVDYIAQRSQTFHPIRSSRVGRPASYREPSATWPSTSPKEENHVKEWVRRFHVGRRPLNFTYLLGR